MTKKISFFIVLVFLTQNLFAYEPQPLVPPIKIAYFVPSDMSPVADRQERLGRVMTYVQNFYLDGMRKNGYGNMTFALEWEDSSDKLVLYTVNGKRKQSEYKREDSGQIRDEVYTVLREKYGFDPNNEVVVIFQQLLKWEDGKATELGPYVGGGTHLAGTAWLYEDQLLDSNLLASKDAGGYYHRPVSLGVFNTEYIGGLAHELGHALSLPHECQLDTEEAKWGKSLMGWGNHTLGQEKRGEGRGAFLSAASALRLSRVRAFAGKLPNANVRTSWEIKELNAVENNDSKSYTLTGRVTPSQKLVGIIVYNDNEKINADYDAKTWVAKVDDDGRFRFEINELENVPYQMRLVGVHENGATSKVEINYEVKDGKADLSPFNAVIPMKRLLDSFQKRDIADIEAIISEYETNNEVQAKAKHAIALLGKETLIEVATLPTETKTADITRAKFDEAKTGWGVIRRGQVPEDVFITVGKKFYESGLYAHAPSVYKLNLDGKWKNFEFGYGVQNGRWGKVRFILRGDGKELFRSEPVTEQAEGERVKTISVENVKTLELIVESATEGISGAWGIWTVPVLSR
ncbi:MAG: NPCBM/NEW2 domain-containing protein [Planctomycetaceae bacterium]|jgi:hypothetical protein|nr:NPCBM/NEW2 domain-containing protein [Planctomycetaceae bacterium]